MTIHQILKLRDAGRTLPANLQNGKAVAEGRVSIIGHFLQRLGMTIPDNCQDGIKVDILVWNIIKENYGLTDKQLSSILLAGELSDDQKDRTKKIKHKIEITAQSNQHKVKGKK